MTASVPTLSEARWVNNVAEKADQLVAYYFAADASQTHLYPDAVVSLPAHVQQYGNDETQLRLKVRESLERYLREYFEQVIVDVTTELPSPDDTNRINLTLECNIVDNGVSYSLSRLITVVNSKVVQIVDILNNQGG